MHRATGMFLAASCAALVLFFWMLYGSRAFHPAFSFVPGYAERHFESDIARYEPNRAVPIALYERYFDTLSWRKMLAHIDARPYCHVEAHSLGELMYRRSRDLPQTILRCSSSCDYGCVHGAMLGFVESERAQSGLVGDPQPADLTPALLHTITALCDTSSVTSRIGISNCYHVLGHLFAYFTDDDVEATLPLCRSLAPHGAAAVFHCASGLYMQRQIGYGPQDLAASASRLYPCDVSDYPAACYRYKLVNLFGATGTPAAIDAVCARLSGADRSGCYLGAGIYFALPAARDPSLANDVCASAGRDAGACLDGLLGRQIALGRDVKEALCSSFTLLPYDTCMKHALSTFSPERDFSEYMIRR